MAEWVKAAETQLSMHHFFTSEQGQFWLRGWIQAAASEEPDKRNMYEMLMAVEEEKLRSADPIWVDPDICEIIQVAREGFKPEALEREDFIVPNGFLYFAKPLWMEDRYRKPCSLAAVSWCPIQVKSERTTEEDRWGMALTLYSSVKEDAGKANSVDYLAEHGITLMPLHLTVVEFSSPFDEGENEALDGSYTGADEWWRTVQVALRLMQQRLAIQVDSTLPRATRRRAERAHHPIREILLIRLRRQTVKHGEESGETRHFTHRFLRGDHWRNQWYPSLGRHRQIWIHPTIVGDESLPLIVKKRYYKWDR